MLSRPWCSAADLLFYSLQEEHCLVVLSTDNKSSLVPRFFIASIEHVLFDFHTSYLHYLQTDFHLIYFSADTIIV